MDCTWLIEGGQFFKLDVWGFIIGPIMALPWSLLFLAAMGTAYCLLKIGALKETDNDERERG